MSVIVWIIFGGLVGLVASALLDTSHTRSAYGHILAGICGGLIGGFIMNSLRYGNIDGFNVYSLITAIVGAVAGLAVFRMIARSS